MKCAVQCVWLAQTPWYSRRSKQVLVKWKPLSTQVILRHTHHTHTCPTSYAVFCARCTQLHVSTKTALCRRRNKYERSKWNEKSYNEEEEKKKMKNLNKLLGAPCSVLVNDEHCGTMRAHHIHSTVSWWSFFSYFIYFNVVYLIIRFVLFAAFCSMRRFHIKHTHTFSNTRANQQDAFELSALFTL